MKAPEANAHAVFVPSPVRHVRQHWLTHRRRQHRARHRPGRLPVLDIDDGPDRNPRPTWQGQRLALVDGAIPFIGNEPSSGTEISQERRHATLDSWS